MTRHIPRFAQAAGLALTLAACGAGASSSASAASPPAGRVDTFRVTMPQFGDRARTIRVYLPPGYAHDGESYPVLYFQDAQSLFSPGAFGDWQMDEVLDRLAARRQFAGTIVVGIDNSEHRWDEYGPWANTHMHDWVSASWSQPTQGGEAQRYLDFMVGTLKPDIDRRYRTRRDREHTAIGGSSMGGIVALYAGITRSRTFGKVLAMSPAVWFAERGGPWLSDNQLLKLVRDNRPPRDVRFYVDIGTMERSRDTEPNIVDLRGQPVSYPRAYAEGALALVQVMRESGVPQEQLRFVVDSGAVHNEAAWSKRLDGALLWLFR
ncbi:MAG: hypothetical protein JWO05_3222 [Gemmatimonadetes bacterium]|nr:hypothetical protein [Gemmatimonadota bacterium]